MAIYDLQGISLVTDVSGDQVEALAGGPLLQQQVLNQERNARQVTPKMQTRASQRLAGALQKVCPGYASSKCSEKCHACASAWNTTLEWCQCTCRREYRFS